MTAGAKAKAYGKDEGCRTKVRRYASNGTTKSKSDGDSESNGANREIGAPGLDRTDGKFYDVV